MQIKEHVYPVSELIEALSTFEIVQSTVGGMLEVSAIRHCSLHERGAHKCEQRQAKAKDALKETSHEVLAELASLEHTLP